MRMAPWTWSLTMPPASSSEGRSVNLMLKVTSRTAPRMLCPTRMLARPIAFRFGQSQVHHVIPATNPQGFPARGRLEPWSLQKEMRSVRARTSNLRKWACACGRPDYRPRPSAPVRCGCWARRAYVCALCRCRTTRHGYNAGDAAQPERSPAQASHPTDRVPPIGHEDTPHREPRSMLKP